MESLPDAVLEHILAFSALPVDQRLRLSIISRRWARLLRSPAAWPPTLSFAGIDLTAEACADLTSADLVTALSGGGNEQASKLEELITTCIPEYHVLKQNGDKEGRIRPNFSWKTRDGAPPFTFLVYCAS